MANSCGDIRINGIIVFSYFFRFVVVEPICRPSLKWYVERQDVIMQDYERRIKEMKLLNVNLIRAMVKTSQFFDTDQVHLTLEAGKKLCSNNPVLRR